MKESDWLTRNDPQRMLEFCLGVLPPERLRQFICGCLAHMARPLGATEIAFHDFLAVLRPSGTFLSPQHLPFFHATRPIPRSFGDAAMNAALRGDWTVIPRLAIAAVGFHALETGIPDHEAIARRRAAEAAERRWQAHLLRCLVGNPYRATEVDPHWLDWRSGALRQLARAIARAQRFADLPILADALEEAGCTDEHLLGHCRADGDHVADCWVLPCLLRDG